MISIVIPVYNVEQYIERCLQSIINQSYKDFEVILVNDGTKDQSIEIAERVLKESEVKWRVINKKNSGQGSSRDEGVRQSEGEYVIFVDADDVVSDDFLQKLINAFDDVTDFTFCNYSFVKQQIPPVDDNEQIDTFDKRSLLESFMRRTVSFLLPSMLFKKSFLMDNGIFHNPDIRFSEDQAFIWKAIISCNKAVYLHKKMYGYYLRNNSTMTSSSFEKIESGFFEYQKIIDELFADHPQYEDIKKYILPRWKLGTLYTSANLMNYEDFLKLYKKMNGKSLFREIWGLNEIKAYLLAMVSTTSPRLLYMLCRKLNLESQ